jgi:hypothetical protein
MVDDEEFATAKILSSHPRSTLFIGENKAAADHANAFGQFATLPPTIEQSCNATRHHNCHIGNDPIGGIPGRNANALTLLQFVAFHKTTCQSACRTLGLGET